MDKYDKQLKQIRYEKYLISMQIKELKKQLVIKKQEEINLIEGKSRSRKKNEK